MGNVTSVQSQLYRNDATAGANQMVHGGGTTVAWEASAQEKLDVNKAFSDLLELGLGLMANPKMREDTQKRFQNLFSMLEQNQIGEGTGKKLIEMAQKLLNSDLRGAKEIQAQLTSAGNFAENKQRVNGVHRVFLELEKHGRMN